MAANISINADTFKDLSKLPKALLYAIYAGVFLVVLILAYFLVFAGQLSDLDDANKEEESLKEKYVLEVIKAASLPTLIADLEQLNKSFAVILQQLPNKPNTSGIVQEIHQAAATNSVSTYLIQPEKAVTDGPIEIIPYKIEVRGEYDALLRFMTDVGQLSQIITIDKITFKPENDKGANSSQFTLSGTANTYHSVETPETGATQETTGGGQ